MARSLTTSIKNNKTDHLFQVGEASPFCKLIDVILTDQAVNRCVACAPFDLLHCIDGKRRGWAP